MKLPRDVSAAGLEKAPRREFGYELTRQTGSHRRLVTQTDGEHHLTVPWPDPIRVGTLRAVLGKTAEHHKLSLDALLRRLNLA